MNRIYRLVWNHTLQAFVVGSEFAAARGKRGSRRLLSPLIVLLGSVSAPAFASDPRLAELLDIANQYAPVVQGQAEVGRAGLQLAASTAPLPVAVDLSVHPASPASSTHSLRSTALAVPSLEVGVQAGTLANVQLGLDAGTATPPPIKPALRRVAAPVVRAVAQTAPATSAQLQAVAAASRATLVALGDGDAAAVARQARQAIAQVLDPAGGDPDQPLPGAPLVADTRRLLHGTGDQVAAVVAHVLPLRDNPLAPVRDVVTTAVTLLDDGLAGPRPDSLGAVVDGVVVGTTGAVDTLGQQLGAGLGAATGSAAAGALVADTTATLAGGLRDTGTLLVAGDVPAVVAQVGGTAQQTLGTTLERVDTLLHLPVDTGLSQVGDALVATTAPVLQTTTALLQGQSGQGGALGDTLAGAVGATVATVGDTAATLLSTQPQQTLPVALDGVGDVLQTLGGDIPALPVLPDQPLLAAVGDTLTTTGGGLGTAAGQLAAGDLPAAARTTLRSTGSALRGGLVGVGATVESLAGNGGTLATTLQQTGGNVGALLAGLDPATTTPGANPLAEVLTDTLGNVLGTVGDVVAVPLGETVVGTTTALAPVLTGTGALLQDTLQALTGSQALASTVGNTVGQLAGGLQLVGGALQQGDLVATVDTLGNTVGAVGTTLLGGTTGVVDGLTGGSLGTAGLGGLLGGNVNAVGDGLGAVVGGLTGATGSGLVGPAAAPAVPAQSGSPGLIIGTGGLTGSLGQLVGPTTSSLFGGDGYVRNGDLAVSSANIRQGYANTSLLGLPLINATPVGTLLDGVGGAATGSNSHLTLIGGVTSDSYITNINNGATGGLLGLVLPSDAPAWASECLNLLGLAATDCWAVNAAQDYQVLIGDGAYANGSKEVVIGTNARHELAQVDADAAFPGAGRNDPDNPTGVPTADYDARLGHSVVIGDNANGSANGQVLLGAGATSDRANSVALGYQSNAARGGQDNYSAFGLAAPQTSIGEVAVGSAGRERQITHVAPGSQATDAVNVAQLQGALDQINDVDIFAVTYDTDANGDPDYSRVTLGTVGSTNATTLANLAAGRLAADSSEAVNGAQLYALGSTFAGYLGGGTAIATGGAFTAPTYTINSLDIDRRLSSADYHDVGSAFAAISQSLANLEGVGGGGSISDLYDPNAVHYDVDGSTGLVVNRVTLTGDFSGDAVAITNLADGAVAAGSRDAVNGGQLAATNTQMAQYLGGSTAYDGDTGTWTDPSFGVTSIRGSGGVGATSQYDNVDDAIAAIDISVVNVNQRIDNLQAGAGHGHFSTLSVKGVAAATGNHSMAAGPEAVATGDHSVALGDAAEATGDYSVAVGAGSQAIRANSVSMGRVGNERQVTNVAAGTADTDAVNLGQLRGGMAEAVDWSRGYVDSRVAGLEQRAAAGVASAMAMAGLPQPYEAGRSMAAIAASSFNGESSLAVGLSGVTDGGRWIYKLSGSTNSRGEGGVSVGAGIQW